jgi:hypothetical protein
MPAGKLNKFSPSRVPVGFVQEAVKTLYITRSQSALSNRMVVFMENEMRKLTARI